MYSNSALPFVALGRASVQWADISVSSGHGPVMMVGQYGIVEDPDDDDDDDDDVNDGGIIWNCGRP